MWDELLFLLFGSIGAITVIFGGYCFGVVWCGAFFRLFFFAKEQTQLK